MKQSELLDVVNKNGKVIGQATRDEVHSNPDLIHKVVHCWIFNSKGEVLWQQRSFQKTESPGKWDMSCGGHVLSGENPKETLQRELKEELGIINQNPKLVKKYIQGDQNQTELIYLYYLTLDQPIEKFTLQTEEVNRVEWIDPQVAQDLTKKGEREATDFIFSQVDIILEILNIESDE